MLITQTNAKRYLLFGTAALLITCVAATTEAKKPGGGPYPPTPPGTVYINSGYDSPEFENGYVMDADGNNPALGVAGMPSYELHDGHRWFLQYGQNEIFATRDDGVRTEQLVSDAYGIEEHLISPPWVPGTGDTAISFLGYDLVNDQQGVFTVPIDWELHDPNPEPPYWRPVAGAPKLAWSIPKSPNDPPQLPGPDPWAYSHSWSADGAQLVYDGGDPFGIYLVDVDVENLVGQTERSVGVGIYPTLSPDGTTVAYIIPAQDLATIRVDGTGSEVVLVEGVDHGSNQSFNRLPIWSPDSEYIIFRHSEINRRAGSFTDDIWRVHRDGGRVVNLTDWANNEVFPAAWRADSVGLAPVPEPGVVVLLGFGFLALLSQRRQLHRLALNRRFVTPLKSNRVFTVAAAILLSMFVAVNAEAKKPGGGPPPPGDVYINLAGYGYVMDADGNNSVPGVAGMPSFALHDDHRWFLQYLDGNPEQNEIVAVRDDGLSVQLTNDPNIGIMHHRIPPPWRPGSGDTTISFLGYDVATDKQGVFTLDIVFSGGVPVAVATTLAWPIDKTPREPTQDPVPFPAAISHSWSADGTQLLYGYGDPDHGYPFRSDLVDLDAGTKTYVGAGIYPSLSSDGTVAYILEDFSLATVDTDGTEVVLMEAVHRPNRFIDYAYPTWSPDSNHIMFHRHEANFRRWHFTDDVWRVDRDGSNAVNLTDWADDGVTPIAWRSDSVSMVPEPGGLVLMGMTLSAWLGRYGRRRQR